MATVTNFADFVTAIQGTEDVVLGADLDAGDSDFLTAFKINCNVDGQGHTIRNMIVWCSSANDAFQFLRAVTIQNLNFKNLLIQPPASGVVLFYPKSSGNHYLKNCKIGAMIDCNNSYLMIGADYSSRYVYAQKSAFDITLRNCTGVRKYAWGNFEFCNLIFRNGNFTSGFSFSLVTGGIILSNCHLGENQYVGLNGGKNHIVLEKCTGTGIRATGSSTDLFCNNGDATVTSITTIQNLTPEQMKNWEYLKSIGFLP